MCRDCILMQSFCMATWVRTSQVPFSLFHFQGLVHEHSIFSMLTSPPPYFFSQASPSCYATSYFLLLLSKVALVAKKSGGQRLSCSNVVLSFGHLPQPRSSYQFGLGTVFQLDMSSNSSVVCKCMQPYVWEHFGSNCLLHHLLVLFSSICCLPAEFLYSYMTLVSGPHPRSSPGHCAC